MYYREGTKLKLYSLKIEGFRRHLQTELSISDATFLIGENNIGKSSVFAALNYLLNDVKKIPESEFFCIGTPEGFNKRIADKIVLTAEFRNLPECAREWFGFRGRILPYDVPNDVEESGLQIVYRKTFEPNKDYVVELKEFKRTKKEVYTSCKTIQDYLDAGLDDAILSQISLHEVDRNRNLTKNQLEALNTVDDLYDFDVDDETWVTNPGGIPGNVLARLPKFLLIPAKDKMEELSGTSGTLSKTLAELFNDVRDTSENYKEAQKYLNLLARELDPSDEESEIGGMMKDLNKIMSDVFPRTGICAEAQLSDPNMAIKPQFKISMFSNIETSVELQGTGMIRAAVFALLRYRNLRENKKDACAAKPVRPLLIGFEEPEIYLHPNAAYKMRDTIYELAESDHNQIICTTHSPYMIDLSKKPLQILNNLSIQQEQVRVQEEDYYIDLIKAIPFNTSEAFRKLLDNDKQYVKMLLKVDDYIAKVFFAQNVLIVEGDTEELVLKETLNRMPDVVRDDILHNWQIIKARGKAVIISLVKYLKAMGINPIVIHDEDKGNAKAEIFNQPIAEALGDVQKRFMLHNCIEDALGYDAPSNDKPYKAYKFISENWGSDWDSVSVRWKETIEQVFSESFKLFKTPR